MKAGILGDAAPPTAMVHQDAIAAAITATFNLPPLSFDALSRGGSRVLEKLVRAYHYWVEEHAPKGICPYDYPRLGYFRMTPDASRALPSDCVHCEHVLPVRVLVHELSAIRGGAKSISLGQVQC